jgi:hypothetical protein
MPILAEHMLLATPDDGLAVAYYGPSETRIRRASGADVVFTQDTDYPFEDTIRLTVESSAAERFPLLLRIPHWCKGAEIRVNGEKVQNDWPAGDWARIDRTWGTRDTVELRLPMKVRVEFWNERAVCVKRGPLLYALPVKAQRTMLDRWGSFDEVVSPDAVWNYALMLDPKDPAASFQFVRQEKPAGGHVWEHSGLALAVDARRVPGWTFVDSKAKIPPLETPEKPTGSMVSPRLPEPPIQVAGPVEKVRLVPYGSTTLRLAYLPFVTSSVQQAANTPRQRTKKYTSRKPDEAIVWQEQVRSELFRALKMDDLVAGKAPQPFEAKEISPEQTQPKYRLREIEINSTPTRRMKIVLTMPTNRDGPLPAVVCIHGHGGNRHIVYDVTTEYRGFAKVLAERGCVTISTDVGQHKVYEKDRLLMGERLWDVMRCVDYLESLPEVDKSRIGCAGLSLGGEMAMWLGAMDERIKATVSSGFLTQMDQLEKNHCLCWKFPGLRELVDFADIYSLIAPRALLCQNGMKEPDWGFYVPIAREAMKEIEVIYADLRKPENVSLVAHPDEHVVEIPSLLAFFEKHLTADTVEVEVQAGKCDRQGVPVYLELPAALRSWSGYQLTDAATGRSVPVQLEKGPSPRLVWMIDDRLAAGSTRRYRLARQDGGADAMPAVRLTRDDRRVRIEVEGKPVLDYNHAVIPSDNPNEPWFRRSGFIHPVFDPAGRVVTDGMPPDHMHQHGIMFAWVDTRLEGRPVDFWNSAKQQGEVRHVALGDLCSGPVFGSFTARLDHVDLTAPGGPKVALHETWQVRVYRRTDGFLFDLVSTQTCAGSSPLVLRQYHYGGMTFRGARPWFGVGKCDFLTSEGKTRADGNHTTARWCDIHGPLEGRVSGVTVFCHPMNCRYPQALRLHPDKPYFCWAPVVSGPITIESGKPYVSAYRYYVHEGELEPALADRLGTDFGDPLVARIRVQPRQIHSLKRLDDTTLRLGGNGDNWHMTWARDDKQYAGLCDGLGWPGMPQAFYNSRLLAVVGDPPEVKFEFLPDYPELLNRGENRELCRYYGFGILSIGDSIYQFLSTPNRPFTEPDSRFVGAKLIYSPDLGRTWHNQDGSTPVRWERWEEKSKKNMAFFEEDSDAFSLLTVLQMGKDYEHNRDGYVYVYAPNGSVEGKMNQLVMFRAAKDRIIDRGAYEFFAGRNSDGSARWSDRIEDRAPVCTFPAGWVNRKPNAYAWHPSVVYYAPLKLYLMANWGMGQSPDGEWFAKPSYLGFWTAPEPWGPWTQVHEETAWTPGGDANARAYQPQIAPRWIADDGRSFWLVWTDFQTVPGASAPWGRPYYAFNVQKVEVVAE